MEATLNRLRYCGFCGYTSPHIGIGEAPWASHFRVVYTTGTGHEPKLSGVGLSRPTEYFVPPEPCQRYDDGDDGDDGPGLAAQSLVEISDIRPHIRHIEFPATDEDGDGYGPDDDDEVAAAYTWGFLFHDACWRLLEQACAPDAIDVGALWRILISVPCCGDVPNWGHTYGGLFLIHNPDTSRRFRLVGAPSRLIIPSVYSDPFHVPELISTVKAMRIANATTAATPTTTTTAAVADDANSGGDPFHILPPEIREMILTHCETRDVGNLRLASGAMRSIPLTQHFFRSRFWPGRELETLFDGFLLGPAERRGLDWAALYRDTESRVRLRRVWLGERNRHRIWTDTLDPLSEALRNVARASRLRCSKYRTVWRSVRPADDATLLGFEGDAVETLSNLLPGSFGLAARPVYGAEVELPAAAVKAVGVSLIAFFGARYVTGLRFVFDGPIDDVEIGYIARHSEIILQAGYALRGFHAALDDCGFTGLALVTDNQTWTEYLPWAGVDDGSAKTFVIRTVTGVVKRVKAGFDVRPPIQRAVKQ